jgi:hypothetical protein
MNRQQKINLLKKQKIIDKKAKNYCQLCIKNLISAIPLDTNNLSQ